MKLKKQDRNLRELFRHRFEYAEVIPGPSVSAKLMRRLAMKEFLRFNPLRFNIYYAGGLLATGLAAFIILSSVPAKRETTPSDKQSIDRTIDNSQDGITAPARQSSGNVRLTDTKKDSERVKHKLPESNKPVIKEIGNEQNDSREKISVAPSALSSSLKDKSLFTQSGDKDFKLKERLNEAEALFESSVTEGCAPLKVTFRSKVAGSDSCQWIFGDGGTSSGRNAEWIYDVEGEYKAILKVFGSDGSVVTSSSGISVFPRPVARFEISPIKAVIPEDEIQLLNYSSAAIKYNWSFGDGSSSGLFEPVHKYDKFDHYNIGLKVYSENGCADSVVIINAFEGSEYYIEFPNAFIPNTEGPSGGVYSSRSDESAQVFHPSFSGVSDYHLKIFSKLGILLFETNDISIGWDGYYRGQLTNAGVYIWKVRGKYMNGEPFTKMGDVTILRR